VCVTALACVCVRIVWHQAAAVAKALHGLSRGADANTLVVPLFRKASEDRSWRVRHSVAKVRTLTQLTSLLLTIYSYSMTSFSRLSSRLEAAAVLIAAVCTHMVTVVLVAVVCVIR
jgi:hypothetical protein